MWGISFTICFKISIQNGDCFLKYFLLASILIQWSHFYPKLLFGSKFQFFPRPELISNCCGLLRPTLLNIQQSLLLLYTTWNVNICNIYQNIPIWFRNLFQIKNMLWLHRIGCKKRTCILDLRVLPCFFSIKK